MVEIEKQFREMKLDFDSIFMMLYDIENNYSKKKANVRIDHKISKKEASSLFLDFVLTMLRSSFHALATQFCKENRISLQKRGRCRIHFDVNGEPMIEASMKGNLEDVMTLAHLYGKFSCLEDNFTNYFFRETIPIFFENLVLSYLHQLGIYDNEIYICQHDRFLSNFEYVSHYMDVMNTQFMDLMTDVPRIMGSLFAVKLSNDYQNDPNDTMKRLEQFVAALYQDDFNGALYALRINAKYKNGHFICSLQETKKLLKQYLTFYESLHVKVYKKRKKGRIKLFS